MSQGGLSAEMSPGNSAHGARAAAHLLRTTSGSGGAHGRQLQAWHTNVRSPPRPAALACMQMSQPHYCAQAAKRSVGGCRPLPQLTPRLPAVWPLLLPAGCTVAPAAQRHQERAVHGSQGAGPAAEAGGHRAGGAGQVRAGRAGLREAEGGCLHLTRFDVVNCAWLDPSSSHPPTLPSHLHSQAINHICCPPCHARLPAGGSKAAPRATPGRGAACGRSTLRCGGASSSVCCASGEDCRPFAQGRAASKRSEHL